MATQRKPTASKNGASSKTSKGKKTTPAARKNKGADMDPRWSILLFALGAMFVVLSFVPGDAAAWKALRDNVLFGLFGISGWILGPMLIYWAILISLGRHVVPAVIKGCLFIAALSGAALVFGKTDFSSLKFGESLVKLMETGKTGYGGGFVSLLFGWSMLRLVGRPAANVLLVIFVGIAVMVFTGVTPGDIARFFGRMWDKLPKNNGYYEEDDEYYEEVPQDKPMAESGYPQTQTAAMQQAPRQAKAPKGGKTSRKWKKVDVDLGPETPPSEPGLAEHGDVSIGPGGTFGMNPLEDKHKQSDDFGFPDGLRLFDPTSPEALPTEPADGGRLLFGEHDPFAVAGDAAKAQPPAQPQSLFDENTSAGDSLFEDELDLFGSAQGAAPVQQAVPVQQGSGSSGNLFDAPSPPPKQGADLPWDTETQSQPAGKQLFFAGTEEAATGLSDLSVDQLIDRAALVKQDKAESAPTTGYGVAGSLNQPAPLYPYKNPPVSLFKTAPETNDAGAREEMKKTAGLLVNTLSSFGVQTRILDVSRGPSVTRYEIQPQAGVKISRITGLADDIALNLAAAGVRIEAPIPGKPAVGIEVPNKIKSTVSIRGLLESKTFEDCNSPLAIALGKDIAGDVVVADLTKMPHLLIAGSTGSGKSVCVNATIMSFLYKSSPEDVRLLLIDPKVVELAEYNGIPHLLMPVVTEPRKAAGALGSAVAEMERRYRLFADNNVRDIRTFNKRAERGTELEKLPYIAIIIDELADLMMTSGKEVEDYICRIAQKARAAGMHLIVATQRPSVDVITGLIKANIPSRVAFAVSSQVDSRTILDGGGAEKLLGMGDMLFMPVGANKPVRVQGTFVQDKEITDVLRYIKEQGGAQYDDDMIEEMERRAAPEGEGTAEGDQSIINDPTFVNAVEIALEQGQISTSFLQRRLRLGYARAGRMMDEMEALHIVSPPDGSKPRQVLINRQDWQEMCMNNAPE